MDPVVGSIIVAVILLAVIILIIHKLVSDKKKGKFSCGGCVGCSGHCAELWNPHQRCGIQLI